MTVLDNIYNKAGEKVAFGKTGVLWKLANQQRLASYEEESPNGKVFGVKNNVIAEYSQGIVFDLSGNQMGKFQGNSLLIEGEEVGSCRGTEGTKAAAIVAFSQGQLE